MTTCMMTSPPARCTLPVGHDGPHATSEGYGWHDFDDMGVSVTAALFEKEAEPTDVWRRRAEKAEEQLAAVSRSVEATDEMAKRAKLKAGELGWFRRFDAPTEEWRAVLTAALTEPPQRPDGAEEIERLLMDADRDGGEVYRTDGYTRLADYLAEGLSKGGVRVVGEEDHR